MAKHQLKIAPTRSAEREVLAERIAQHAAVLARLDQLQTAAERASGLLRAAFSAKEKAAEALSEARAGENEYLVNELVAGRELATSPTVRAEHDAKEADRQIERARQARDAATAEIEVAARDIELLKRQLDDAAGAVLAAETADKIAALLEEAKKTQADLVSRRCVLRFLHKNNVVADAEVKQEVRNFLRHNDDCLPGTFDSTEFERYDAHRASQVWAAAREALSSDADAPLPI